MTITVKAEACPYCDGLYAKRFMPQHVGACIENPAVYAAVKSVMLDLAENGVAPSAKAYRKAAKPLGLPSVTTLSMQMDWDALCEKLGLMSANRASKPEFQRELILEEAKRLAKLLQHENGYGPNQTEWELFSDLSIDRVRTSSLFGNWDEMLAGAGLVKGPAAYYKACSIERQERLEAMTEREIKRVERGIAAAERSSFMLKAIDRGIKEVWDWTTMAPVRGHVYELR